MTGSVQVILSAGGGAVQAFTASLRNNSTATGVRSATFSLFSDGTSSTGSSGTGGTTSCGPWYVPNPTTGIGSLYYAKLTVSGTGTTYSGSAVGSVVGLSGTAGWTFTSSGATTEGVGTGTVAIYSDAGGTNLVATGNVSWDVGYTP